MTAEKRGPSKWDMRSEKPGGNYIRPSRTLDSDRERCDRPQTREGGRAGDGKNRTWHF